MSEFNIIGRGKNVNRAKQQSLRDNIDATKSAITVSQHERKQRKVRRSADLIEAVKQIDIQSDPAMQQAILEWVEKEYDKRGGGKLIGLFSKCYLGHPYCDHRMDLSGSIIEHYTLGEAVPPAYSQARLLAASSSYAFIEVYSDGEVVPVREDGTI